MPAPKFNFIPTTQMRPSTPGVFTYRVTISKDKQLVFSTSVLDELELRGKKIRLFADKEKKAIGFRAWGEGKLEDIKELDLRTISSLKDGTGPGKVYVGGLLSYLEIPDGLVFKDLELKLYKRMGNFEEGEVRYVILEGGVPAAPVKKRSSGMEMFPPKH